MTVLRSETATVKQTTDLSVDFAGITLRNPVIAASSPLGWSGERIKKTAQAGVGAVVTKTIAFETSVHPRVGRFHVWKIPEDSTVGIHSTELYSTIPLERWLSREFKIAAEGGVPVIASISPYYPNTERTAELASALAEAPGVKMLEINASCPNVRGEEAGGLLFATTPEYIFKTTKAAVEAVDIPVMVKLGYVLNIRELAEAAEKAGADAIHAINGPGGISRIDIETGKPANRAVGGICGSFLKPMGLFCVADLAASIKVPLCGGGGIETWQDAMQYVMVGATVVQTCTAVMLKGYEVITDMVAGIDGFVKKKGYDSYRAFAKDWVGKTLKYGLTSTSELAKEAPLVSQVDEGACNGCGICERICMYDAIKLKDGLAKSDPDNCDGCNMCVELCPTQAIELVTPRSR